MKRIIKPAIIVVSACLLMFMVRMCKSENLEDTYQKDKEDIKQLSVLQHESDSLLTEVLHDIDTKKHQYSDDIDSLNNIILNDNLTVEEVNRLKLKIRSTQKLLRDAQSAQDIVIIDAGITISEMVLDSIVYNYIYIYKDSIIWNVVEIDSIVYNIIEIDTINKSVYIIDSIYYDSNEIKKLKLKNN